MAIFELAIPAWAEYKKETPWHPGHIAERYGLLTIIVLGESVLASTNAVQVALDQQGTSFDAMLSMTAGGLLILFSIWWLYFSKSAEDFLSSIRVPFLWGYGHYFIFASVAAVGAGLGVNVDQITGDSVLSDVGAAATITIPVTIFLCMLWMLHIRFQQSRPAYSVLFTVATVVVLAATFTSSPILLTGFITTALVVTGVILSHKKSKPSANAE